MYPDALSVGGVRVCVSVSVCVTGIKWIRMQVILFGFEEHVIGRDKKKPKPHEYLNSLTPLPPHFY